MAADLSSRITVAQAELQRIEKDRDEAGRQLPAVEQQVKAARQQLEEVQTQAKGGGGACRAATATA